MVFDLDIANQDVDKIADMIDSEISYLVPQWRRGSDLLQENHQLEKKLEALNCSGHQFPAIHGRFEEITYQIDVSDQCVTTDGAPVVSSQSDIWVHHDQPQRGSDQQQAHDFGDDYENEIRHNLRWLKAKYEMQLRDLRDQQVGHESKPTPGFSIHLDKKLNTDDKKETFNGRMRIEKNLCTRELLPQHLHRAASLPVDAIDV